MQDLPDILGLSAKRKAEREKIAAAFEQVAAKHGAEFERENSPRFNGWHGPGIDITAKLNGVGGSLDIDDLHGGDGALISWYNASYPARDFSASFMCAAGDVCRGPHHKASSHGDWQRMLRQFDAALAVVAEGRAFLAEAA